MLSQKSFHAENNEVAHEQTEKEHEEFPCPQCFYFQVQVGVKQENNKVYGGPENADEKHGLDPQLIDR